MLTSSSLEAYEIRCMQVVKYRIEGDFLSSFNLIYIVLGSTACTIDWRSWYEKEGLSTSFPLDYISQCTRLSRAFISYLSGKASRWDSNPHFCAQWRKRTHDLWNIAAAPKGWKEKRSAVITSWGVEPQAGPILPTSTKWRIKYQRISLS